MCPVRFVTYVSGRSQWFSKPARNFTPVISHLWSLTALTSEIAGDEELAAFALP